MARRPLLVYLDDEDREKLERMAKEEAASGASPIARRILHQALAKLK